VGHGVVTRRPSASAELHDLGAPAGWSVYFGVDDADAAQQAGIMDASA
jgi:hypothetical protein